MSTPIKPNLTPAINPMAGLSAPAQTPGQILDQALAKLAQRGVDTAGINGIVSAEASARATTQFSKPEIVEFKPSNVAKNAEATKATVERTAMALQEFVQSMGRDLAFSVDSTTGYHVVKVTDPKTGDVVRQIPSAELLRIAQNFPDYKNALVSQIG